jgi:hypothetical protein
MKEAKLLKVILVSFPHIDKWNGAKCWAIGVEINRNTTRRLTQWMTKEQAEDLLK